MKVLVGYDGSESSDALLDDLRRAGLPADAEVALVTVASERAGGGDEAAQMLGVAAARIRAAFPRAAVTTEVREGTPARVLIDRADAWTPDLLVVGSHGRSALGRLLLGSVSHKVVSEARCSVRVARRDPDRKGEPVRILLGVDGSPNATGAARAVAARSWPAGSEARVVAVVSTNAPDVDPATEHETIGMQVAEWIARAKQRAERAAEDAAQILSAAGLKASPCVREGSPRQVLVEEAAAWEADCVFVGATGMGRFHEFLLGSVSSAVVMRAPCSVEVVRGRSVEPA